jgi:hypothetical protein
VGHALARRLGCVAAALVVASCGSSPGPACPTFPSTCTSPAPSYATDVAPIIQARCAPCHSPTGIESAKPYQTWADVKRFQIDILIQVRACRMPPAGAEPLSMAEQATLLAWLVCDGPNN